MPVSLYDMSIPMMMRSMQNLSTILNKAADAANTEGISQSSLIDASLHPNMLKLPFQIQCVSDTAKGVAIRLGNQPPAPMADNEASFPELQERLKKTLDILAAVDKNSMDGKEHEQLQVKFGPGTMTTTGLEYLQFFAIPNFYFHLVTAYGILRSEGIDIGKYDYLAGLNWKKNE